VGRGKTGRERGAGERDRGKRKKEGDLLNASCCCSFFLRHKKEKKRNIRGCVAQTFFPRASFNVSRQCEERKKGQLGIWKWKKELSTIM
jgi:hypothetical protein